MRLDSLALEDMVGLGSFWQGGRSNDCPALHVKVKVLCCIWFNYGDVALKERVGVLELRGLTGRYRRGRFGPQSAMAQALRKSVERQHETVFP